MRCTIISTPKTRLLWRLIKVKPTDSKRSSDFLTLLRSTASFYKIVFTSQPNCSYLLQQSTKMYENVVRFIKLSQWSSLPFSLSMIQIHPRSKHVIPSLPFFSCLYWLYQSPWKLYSRTSEYVVLTRYHDFRSMVAEVLIDYLIVFLPLRPTCILDRSMLISSHKHVNVLFYYCFLSMLPVWPIKFHRLLEAKFIY